VSDQSPLVSVLIPTFDRPGLLQRAVRSALAQTLHDIEVIAVLDGASDDSRRSLAEIDDPRLRILDLERNQGAPAARTAGVQAARAEWIAHLDDDDEWFPHKLELQLRTASASAFPWPIVACRLIARANEGDFVWPRRRPRPNEPLSEYLFCGSGPTFGEGVLPSSVLFVPRGLCLRVPPRCEVAYHDDIDWLIRAGATRGVGVEMVASDAPLAIWHREGRAPPHNRDWHPSLNWIRSHASRVTPRAYASFVLRWIGSGCARKRQWEAFGPLLGEALRRGRPTSLDLAVYFAHWLIPPRLQPRLGHWWSGVRRALPGPSGEDEQ